MSNHEPQMLVVGPRKRGRVTLSGTSEPSSVLSVRLPESRHDQLLRMAASRHMEPSEFVRELIDLTLPR